MKPNASGDETEGSTFEVMPVKDDEDQQQAVEPETQTETESQDTNMAQKEWVYRSAKNRIEDHVDSEVNKLIRQCRLFQDDEYCDDLDVAVFHRSEVMTCNILGNGAFSEVHQVWGIRPCGFIDDARLEFLRQYVRKTAIDDKGSCNYVIKHLRRDLMPKQNCTSFVQAAADLFMEAKFLSKFDHPNIVALRGWAGGVESFGEGSHDGFFLLLDRLDHTLTHRIMRWQVDKQEQEKVYSKALVDYREKLDIGRQIASALEFLHAQDVIFRDLKPDNIGFKGNTVKIFDFGLCRELPEENPNETSTFHMSGVGTRRYMAPEVFLGQHYNLKADVYSWTIVFHAMLSLHRPFEMYNAALHKLLVCEEGVRPTIFPEWPSEIQSLCRTGWARKSEERPTIKLVVSKITKLIRQIDEELDKPTGPGVSLIEASLQFMDKFAQNLCEDFSLTTNKIQAKQVLRLLEMHMHGENGMRDRVQTTRPHLQHLRSQYL